MSRKKSLLCVFKGCIIFLKEVLIMKKILVVVDMQNDFIDMALGTKEAVAIVPKVKAKIQEVV